MNVASPLPIFTPSYGHTYMPPGPRAADAPQATSQSQQSKESTPIPETQSTVKTSLTTGTTNVKDTSYQDTRGLMEALNLLSKYGDEYMDETPLTGEPGSFILSKSTEAASSSSARRGPKTNMHAPAVPRKPATPAVGETSTPSRGME
jgi:mediator of RNA polymerase II transcription subunit 6